MFDIKFIVTSSLLSLFFNRILGLLVEENAKDLSRVVQASSRKSKHGTISSDVTDWYYDAWCGQGDLYYLDDRDCVKVFPSLSPTRDWVCSASDETDVDYLETNGYQIDSPLPQVKVDIVSLNDVVTEDVNACVILTKRVLVVSEGEQVTKLYNKYFCYGESSKSDVHETWSSSKIFAMANAGGHLRTSETTCMTDQFGLDDNTIGNHGVTPLGDLASIVCSYDTTAGYSSNGLSSYFHDLGWRDRIHDLVTSDWLGLDNHTLGGNYGVATPSDLSFNISTSSKSTCIADKDPWPTVYDNSLTALAAAEMARRIVMHADLDEDLRFPGLTSVDAQNIMLGAEDSLLFPGATWGGMSVDTAIFVQSGLNMTDIEARSAGTWRIYSKLGAGYSSSRNKGEIVTTAYACLPVTTTTTDKDINDDDDDDDDDDDNMSVEFSISVRGSVSYDYSLEVVQERVASAVKSIVAAVVSGTIA